jgi:hypothetical protein
MTIIVVAKSSEGLAVAADSKMIETGGVTGKETARTGRKIVSFRSPHNFVCFTICGVAMEMRTLESYFEQFERGLLNKRLTVKEYAEELDVFMRPKWSKDLNPRPETMEVPGLLKFLVTGFDENEDGRIYEVLIPSDPKSPNPIEVNTGNKMGIFYHGPSHFAHRLIRGYFENLPRVVANKLATELKLDLNMEGQSRLSRDIQNAIDGFRLPISDSMSLDNAKDFATMLVRTIIDGEYFTSLTETRCDYPIDVCCITAIEGVTRYPRIFGYKELKSPLF